MNRIIVSIFSLVVFVACGGDSAESLIINNQGRTPFVTLDTFASSPGTLINGEGIGTGDDTCGDIQEINGYRTDSVVVFRYEVSNDFCFGTDLHQVVLLDVNWKGKPGTIVFYNFGNPATNPNGAAYFREAGTAYDEVLPEILVTQWMDDPDDAHFYLSVPLEWFGFTSESDTLSVFRVAAQTERGSNRVPIDWTDPVNVDFNDLP